MKTSLYLKVLVVLLCCGFVFAQEPSPTTTVTAAISGATISDFKGKVMIQLPGQALVSPTRGQVLPPESIVNTDDGRLLLKLSDGSDVLVRPHTHLIVKQPETGAWRYLQLLIGRIRTQVQKHLGGTPGFQIGTPSAVISVRGTRFDVEVNRHGFTQVDVDEGVVELESLTGHGSVMVPAGFSSRIGTDSGPEVPRPTRELRPQLDRPRSGDDRDSGSDDAMRKLESSDGGHSGSSGGDSGDGEHSGSSGSSGSDDGSHSGSSGSDDGVSGSSSGSSGPDGGHKSGPDSGGSDGDRHGDHHGGKPPR